MEASCCLRDDDQLWKKFLGDDEKNGFHLKNESDIDDDEWFPHIGILKPVHFQSDQEFDYNRWWESFIDFQTFTF